MLHTCPFSFQKQSQEKWGGKLHKWNDEIPVFLIDNFSAYNSNCAI